MKSKRKPGSALVEKKRPAKNPGKLPPGKPATAPKRAATKRAPAKKLTRAEREAREHATRLEKVEKICDLYRVGTYTLESCCANVGTDDSTLRLWCAKYPDIHEIYKSASDEHSRRRLEGPLKEKALNSFERLITGYDYTEDTQTVVPVQKPDGSVQMVVQEIRRAKKHVAPHAGMVAMGMRNFHGLKDRLDIQHGGTIGIRQEAVIGGISIEF
jgi:hypothetical protein